MKNLSDLQCFCDFLVRKYGNPGEASEEQKADDFRAVYLKGLPFNLKTLKAVADSCGIKLSGLDNMPENLRGYHEIYGENKSIYFRKNDTLSGIQNTILHEIREMMETLFTEGKPDYEPLRTNARHLAANRFASAVLLPRNLFTAKVYETGFDVIELAHLYSKSCPQVLLRMGEVLTGKLFLYSALYEPCSKGNRAWQVSYWTGCRNDEDPEANVYGTDGFFPRKGRSADAGSLADMAIKDGLPHLARVTIINTDEDGLIALARPLINGHGPVKVALIAVLSNEVKLIEPQIQRVKPVVAEGIHCHL
jgi:hypothetical protein